MSTTKWKNSIIYLIRSYSESKSYHTISKPAYIGRLLLQWKKPVSISISVFNSLTLSHVIRGAQYIIDSSCGSQR